MRGAPQSGFARAHLANERAQLSRDLRSANTVARLPAPIRPKPSTVPANNRFRPDNRNRAQDGGKPAIEPNEQKTIGIVQIWWLRHPPAKHVDLLPQDPISASSVALDLACQKNPDQNPDDNRDHERTHDRHKRQLGNRHDPCCQPECNKNSWQ